MKVKIWDKLWEMKTNTIKGFQNTRLIDVLGSDVQTLDSTWVLLAGRFRRIQLLVDLISIAH